MPFFNLQDRRLQTLLVGVLLFVLALAATWPIATDPAHLSVVRPADNDYRLNNYFVFWGAHALLTDPLNLHHTNMFHPERYTFVYADILLAHSLLMLPVIEAFYNPVLTYNVLLWVSFTLGGVGFFVLARQATGHPGAATLGALLWVFNPIHFTRYQQVQFFGDHWLPWMAWALWCWLSPRPGADEAQRNSWPALAAVFFALNALSGSHNAVFGALLAGVMILYFVTIGSLWRQRRFIFGLAIFSFVAMVALAPIFWPYLAVEGRMASGRATTLDLPNASLRPLEMFSARSRLYVWLDETVGWPSVLNPQQRELRTYAFPGVVTLVLAGLGLAWPQRPGGRDRRLWLISLALFFFLALGTHGGYLLVGNLPLFRLIRVPTRFMMPAVLCLAMIASYGAAALAEWARPRRITAALFAAIVILFAVEAGHAPVRTWPYEQEPRLLNEFLARQPGDFAIVEFPLDPFGATINMRQVYQSVFHWKRLLVGYSGYQSEENIDLLRSVRDRFPSAACLDDLNLLNVRYVIVLADRVDPEFLEAVSRQPRLVPAWSHEQWLVYEVTS